MDIRNKARILLLVATLQGGAAGAQSFANPCQAGSTGARMVAAATIGAEGARQDAQVISDNRTAATKAALACLAKYANISVGGIFGFPDLTKILQAILAAIVGKACQILDAAVQRTVAPFNQGVVLPGGVGRINTQIFVDPNGVKVGGSGGVNGTVNIPGVGGVPLPSAPVSTPKIGTAGASAPAVAPATTPAPASTGGIFNALQKLMN